MEILDRQINGVTVIALTGSIDALTAPAIAESINGIISRGEINLVADFQGIDYTSSAGLRVLLGAVKETRSRGGDLRLAGALHGPQPQRQGDRDPCVLIGDGGKAE